MTWLQRFRRASGWILPFAAVAVAVAVIAPAVPHDDGPDSDGLTCLVCKVGRTPLQYHAPVFFPERAPSRFTVLVEAKDTEIRLEVDRTRNPRAPPA